MIKKKRIDIRRIDIHCHPKNIFSKVGKVE